MKKSLYSILGVTLLEIMLVLAIASMVILMSIRYYQSASANQKVNAALDTITGIVAGGESVLAAKGSMDTIVADIVPYLPNNKMPKSPWGGDVSVAFVDSQSYTISMYVPTGSATVTNVCLQLASLVNQNGKMVAACAANAISVKVNT